jgi:hypothetical protein
MTVSRLITFVLEIENSIFPTNELKSMSNLFKLDLLLVAFMAIKVVVVAMSSSLGKLGTSFFIREATNRSARLTDKNRVSVLYSIL